MALENILQKIQSDAQKEIEVIKKTATKEAGKLGSEAEKKFREIKNKLNDKLRKEQTKYLENIQNSLDSDIQNEILRKKQELLNEIYNKVARKVTELPPEDYAKFVLSLLKQLPQLKDGQILCAEKDKNLIAEYLAKSALPYKIAEKNADITGGFILQNKEIEIDATLETIMGRVWKNTQIEVGKILFSK